MKPDKETANIVKDWPLVGVLEDGSEIRETTNNFAIISGGSIGALSYLALDNDYSDISDNYKILDEAIMLISKRMKELKSPVKIKAGELVCMDGNKLEKFKVKDEDNE